MGGNVSELIGPAIAGIMAGIQFNNIWVGIAVFAASYAAVKLAPQPEIPEQDSFNMAEKDRKLSFRQPHNNQKISLRKNKSWWSNNIFNKHRRRG